MKKQNLIISQIKRKIKKLEYRLDSDISKPEYMEIESRIENLKTKIYPCEINRGWF